MVGTRAVSPAARRIVAAVAEGRRTADQAPTPAPAAPLGKRKRPNIDIPPGPLMRRPRTAHTPDEWSDDDMVRVSPIKAEDDGFTTLDAQADDVHYGAMNWRDYPLPAASKPPRPPLPSSLQPLVWSKVHMARRSIEGNILIYV